MPPVHEDLQGPVGAGTAQHLLKLLADPLRADARERCTLGFGCGKEARRRLKLQRGVEARHAEDP